MPNFTYNTNIPAASNNPSVDQPNMQTNTNSISSILNVDMIGFGNANGGFHSKVTFVDQGSGPGSSASQLVLYSKLVSGVSQLFFQRDGVGTEVPLTGALSASSNGYMYLPGGILLQWFSVNFGAASSVSASFPIAFPNAVFSVVGNQNAVSTGTTSFIGIGLTSLSAVTLWRSSLSGTNTAYMIAIGN